MTVTKQRTNPNSIIFFLYCYTVQIGFSGSLYENTERTDIGSG